MSDSSKKSIPSWQRPEAPEEQSQIEEEEKTATHKHSDANADAVDEAPKDRSILLDEAKRFLEDATVRNAAPEHKVAFLKSKGVQSREIQQLLDARIPSQREVCTVFRSYHHKH